MIIRNSGAGLGCGIFVPLPTKLYNMTEKEAIVARHSVRQYIDKPIEAEKIAQLRALIDECNRKAGLHIQLVTDEPNAFSGGLAKYGKFSGISNYIAMVCKKGDDVNLGY